MRPHREARLLIVPDELTVTTEEQLRALLPPETEPAKPHGETSNADGFDELKAELRNVLATYKTKEARGYMYAPGRCHGSMDGCGVWMRTDNNSVGCFKSCDIGSILTAYGLPAFPIRQTKTHTQNNTPPLSGTPPSDTTNR